MADIEQEMQSTKSLFKKHLQSNIDRLVDKELQHIHDGTAKPQNSLLNFIRGLYYLTIAKFTNPIAYQIAWQTMAKLNEKAAAAAANHKGCTCSGAITDMLSSSSGTTVSSSESGNGGKTGVWEE